jgi:hypothetical protein
MKVRELLAVLDNFPGDMQVLIPGDDRLWDALDTVGLGKTELAHDREDCGAFKISNEGELRILLSTTRHPANRFDTPATEPKR